MPTPSDQSNLLRIDEAAKLLGVEISTLRSWVYKKRIPYVKLGGCLRFRRADLDDFISEHRVPAIVTDAVPDTARKGAHADRNVKVC
jgi:excisionase family DNA binding protein